MKLACVWTRDQQRIGKTPVIHLWGESMELLAGRRGVLDKLFPLEAEAGNQLGAAEMKDNAVKDVGEENGHQREFLKPDGGTYDDDDYDEGSKTGLCLPVDLLETGVSDRAYH